MDWDSRRPNFYLRSRRCRFGGAQLPYKSRAEKLCDRSLEIAPVLVDLVERLLNLCNVRVSRVCAVPPAPKTGMRGTSPHFRQRSEMTRLRTPLLAAALFTSVAAVGLTPALAQTAAAPTNAGPAAGEAHHQARARMMPGQFVEGRIAFLKAELKITPAQEAQWQQVEGDNT